MEVRFEDKQIKKFIADITSKSKNRGRLHKIISTIAMRDVDRHFKQGMGPEGKWKTRGKVTKAGISKQNPKLNKTLMRSGQLKNSIQWKSKGWNVVLTALAKYASIHNEGATITPKGKYLFIPISKRAAGKAPGAHIPDNWKGNIAKFNKKGQSFGLNKLDYIFAKKVTIPKREFMYLGDDGLKVMSNALLNHMVK